MRSSLRVPGRWCRASSSRWRRCLVAAAVLALIAVAASGGQAAASNRVPAKSSHATHSLACRNLHIFILYYMTHVAPNASGVSPQPNGCWTWADLRGVSQPNWTICRYNNTPFGSGGSFAYDDTNPNHTSPTDSNQITSNCLGGHTTLNVEYEATGGCSSANWTGVVPTGVTVNHFQLETYCTDSDRDHTTWVNGFTYTSTVGAVVNVGADVPSGDGGPCTLGATTCQNDLTNDVETACNNTPSGDWMSLYSDYPTPADVVGWVNAALNTCS